MELWNEALKKFKKWVFLQLENKSQPNIFDHT
jgi:hypothetical protein